MSFFDIMTAFIAVFVYLAIFGSVGALIVAIVKLLFLPLEVPTTMRYFDREFFLISFGLPAFILSVISCLRKRAAPASAPRFALSELLAMIFGLGLYPLIVSAGFAGSAGSFDKQADMTWHFIVGATYFPGLYWSALQRLDSNKVPLGISRVAFLCLFPYAVISVVFCLPLLIAGHEFLFVAACATIMVSSWVGVLAKRSALRQAAQDAFPPPEEKH